MAEVILKGRKIAGGKAEGEALVSHESIGYMASVDLKTGIVIEKGHELEGISLAGKILVYPTGKGSTSGSFGLYELARSNLAPKGIINMRADPITAVGAIMGSIPMIDRLSRDPTKIIKTGDFVELDASQGTVRIKRGHA